uniref:Uncharacterized protein n=1 Tax=Anguilla anguilla TaxID=7936 RepID=A0A0E9SU28_ANGAN
MTIKKLYLNCTMYGKFKSRQIDIAICMEMVICVFIKFYIVFFLQQTSFIKAEFGQSHDTQNDYVKTIEHSTEYITGCL